MAIKYPDWAPQAVIKFYEKSVIDNEFGPYQQHIKNLLIHQNMESVWKALIKRKKMEGHLVRFVVKVLFARIEADRNDPAWEKMTITKRKELKSKVECLIDELDECMYLVPSVMKEDIVDLLPKDVAFDLAVRRFEVSYRGRTYREISKLYKEGDRIPGFGRIMIIDFLRCLKKVCENIDPEFGLLKRPGKINSNQLLFIRRLGNYLRHQYGAFLYEVIANTTSVVFETEIHKDEVRDSLKAVDWDRVNKYGFYN